MKWANQFSSENVLMSVAGHLVLAAVIVTSLVVVLDRARFVAPDRIEIMEIDLNSVTVSGDDTRLRNINPDDTPAAPPPTVDKKKETPPAPQPEPKPEPEAPTVVEEPDETPEPEPVAEPEPKPTPVEPETPPEPKKKTVVKVNREVMSLDRKLTVSVVDALRVAMTRCWTIDTTRPDLADIRAVAHMTMRQNGTVRDVWFESAARAETDPAFAYVLSTIRDAINVCQPFKMLPPAEFSKWEKIQLTFYPTQGKVM